MGIPKITLTEEAAKAILSKLERMYEVAQSNHRQQWKDRHDLNMRQYLAFPLNEIKTKPYLGASNLFMPLTRIVVHGVLYREDALFFNQDPYLSVKAIGRPKEPMNIQRQMSAEKLNIYYQNLYRYVIPLRRIVKIGLKENAIDGTAVFHPRWSNQYVVQRIEDIEWDISMSKELDMRDPVPIEVPKIRSEPYWNERAYIRRLQQPVLDNTNLSCLMVPPGTGSSLQWPECPWYIIKRDLTWEQCLSRSKNGYEGVDSELQATLETGDVDPRERSVRQESGLSPTDALLTTPLLEFYMRLPLPGEFEMEGSLHRQDWRNLEDGYEEEVVVSVWWKTKKFARIRPLSRIVPPDYAGRILRPHHDLRFHIIPRFFYGLGLAQMMRYLNKAINQYVNQGVDYGTLINVPFFFFQPSAGLVGNIVGIEPGIGIPVDDAGGVKMPSFHVNPEFFAQRSREVLAWAERDTSVTDTTQGRNTDLYSIPPTARGMMVLQNEGNLAFNGIAMEHASVVEEVFNFIHLLHQKNAPNSVNFLNNSSGNVTEDEISGAAFRQQVEVRFQVNPNTQAEQQNAVALTQFMMSIPYINQQPRGVRQLARNVWEKSGPIGNKPAFEEIWPEEVLQVQQQGQAPGQGVVQGQVIPFPAPLQSPTQNINIPTIPDEDRNIEITRL